MKKELQLVDHVAMTADGWSSVAQDHYLTVTAHYIAEGELSGKVLHTRAVYVSQTGVAVAEEIGSILDDFDVKSKVSAITVDNASNMEVAVKRMEILKMPCFAHTLNIAAQKLYNVKAVSNWSARVRAVVVWLRRNNLAKVVLKEKFKLLYGKLEAQPDPSQATISSHICSNKINVFCFSIFLSIFLKYAKDLNVLPSSLMSAQDGTASFSWSSALCRCTL